MARKTMWAVAGALLAFAPAASALQFDVELENQRIYAAEVITGADAEIDYVGTEPVVEVSINFLADESQGISEGDAITLDFTFANAVFAENVRAGAIGTPQTGMTGCGLRAAPNVGDGDEGDNTVQFTIEATGGACANGTPTFVEIDFEVPRLKGLAANRPVTVSVLIDAPGGSGWPTPTDLARTAPSTRTAPGVPAGKECSDASPRNCTKLEGKVVSLFAPRTDTTGHGQLIRYAPGLTLTGTSGGSSTIDFAGGRTTFLRGLPGTLGSVMVGVATAAACTTDDPIPEGCALQLDGKEFTIDRNGDGQGTLNVSVTGDFREDDSVWLEHNGQRGMQDTEALEMQDDGSMTGMFRLSDVAGASNPATGPAGDLDREQGVATRTLHYMPNGEVPLREASFRSRYSVDFADNAVRDKNPTPASGEHTTVYPRSSIEDTQHAYAIPGVGSDDTGNLRIKCEVATSCTVYLECDDAAGDSWFAELAAPIAGRATQLVQSGDIADMLNLGEDGWEGELSCSVLSTRKISVQLLTRSAQTLVNTTYVERDE